MCRPSCCSKSTATVHWHRRRRGRYRCRHRRGEDRPGRGQDLARHRRGADHHHADRRHGAGMHPARLADRPHRALAAAPPSRTPADDPAAGSRRRPAAHRVRPTAILGAWPAATPARCCAPSAAAATRPGRARHASPPSRPGDHHAAAILAEPPQQSLRPGPGVRPGASQRRRRDLAVPHRTRHPDRRHRRQPGNSPGRSAAAWMVVILTATAMVGHWCCRGPGGSLCAGRGACCPGTASSGSASRPGCTHGPGGCPWSCASPPLRWGNAR